MKKTKKIILISILLLFVCGANIYADATAFKNSTGVYAILWGNEGGYGGLHYQRWFNKLGFQATFGGWIDSNPGEGVSNAECLFSVELLLSLYQHDFSEKFGGLLYAWLLGGYFGDTDIIDEKVLYQSNALTGFGIGFETVFFEHWSFPLQCGFICEYPHNTNLGFSGSIGFRYRF